MAEFTHKCPYCNQELLLEDDWAGQAIVCPKCNNSVKVPDRQKAAAERYTMSRFSSAYCIDKSHRRVLDGFCLFGYISVIVPLGLLVIAFRILADKGQTGGGVALLSAILSIPFAILGAWTIPFTSDLMKPYKKITYSKITDVLLIIYGIINSIIFFIIAGIWILRTIANIWILGTNAVRGIFLIIPIISIILGILIIIIAISGVSSMFRVRSFYKLRAEEDADYTEEEIAAEKDHFLRISNGADVSVTVRIANALSVGSFIPFAGLVFILPAILLTISASKKGFIMVKSVICIIIGCIINTIVLCKL